MNAGGRGNHTMPCAIKNSDPNHSNQFHHSYAKVNGDDSYADTVPHTDKKKAHLRHVHVACSFIMLLLVLAIMMWDMKKVQTMSTIIHDDHRSLWVSMNSTILKFWYNSYDLCVLNRGSSSITRSRSDNNQRNGSAMSIISPNNIANIVNNNRQCNSMTSASQDSSKQIPLRCNVGYGYHNLDCLGNLTMRSFYRYMLNDRALGDPRNMMLRTVLLDLSMTKRSIVILGDGVSKQSQDAMICEMLRTDKSVKVSSKASFYSSNYTLRWPKERRQVDLFYFRLVNINADDNDAPHRRKQRRRRVLNHSIDDATINSSHEVVASDISTNDSSSRWVISTTLSSNDSQASNTLSENSSQSLANESVLSGSSDLVVDTGAAVRDVDTVAAVRDVDTGAVVRDVDGSPVPSMDGFWANNSMSVVDERPLFSTQLVDRDSEGAMNNSSSIDFNASPIDTMESNDTTTIVDSSSSSIIISNISISNISHADNDTLSGDRDPPPQDKRVASVRFTYVQSRVRALLEQYRSLVVVVNVGVYYNSREQFRTDLPQLLDWMHSLYVEHNCTVFFRETAAQHWSHTSSGYFEMDIDGQNSSLSSCMPVADSTPEYDWRNRDVNNYISNEGYEDSIHVIPFRDLTLPLYSMHPSNDTHQDCTHYCYFPQMWQNMWYYLYHRRS